jgi:site-specific DNA-methyltransferase (adenine-specific)
MDEIKPYYEEEGITVYCGDCLEVMKQIPDKSIDLVLTDPPYGVTQNKQDIVVDLAEVFRVSNGVVLTAQQPYTTDVIYKHRKYFKYDLVWNKVLTSGFLNANRMPLRTHESILVFGDVQYFPQKTLGSKNHSKGKPKECANNNYGKHNFVDNTEKLGYMKCPTSIIVFPKPHPSVAQHRTEKPIELMRWLVKTYSKIGDTILDPFLGSGTTLVAAKELGRKAIGIEISDKYCEIAVRRIKNTVRDMFV